jgi:hypothetical protein
MYEFYALANEDLALSFTLQSDEKIKRCVIAFIKHQTKNGKK